MAKKGGADPDMHLSIVIPAHNEAENIPPLLEEIAAAIDPLGVEYEIVLVDDGSTDATPEVIRRMLARHERLKAVRMRHTPAGRGHGQSAAFHAGIRASRGSILAFLDADLQNDPADIPRLLEVMEERGADLVQGDRSARRSDGLIRRFSSWVGRLFRRTILRDPIRDTACSLRVIRREVALAIPLQYRGMHRYVPVTARRLGYEVVEIPVNHRPRMWGSAKYGMLNRAIPGLYDVFAVRWMLIRTRPVEYEVLEPEPDDVEAMTETVKQ